jgi:hypothetical protein
MALNTNYVMLRVANKTILLIFFMPIVTILSVVMLNVVMLFANKTMQIFFMLNVTILSVVMLNVVMLSVAAPQECLYYSIFLRTQFFADDVKL